MNWSTPWTLPRQCRYFTHSPFRPIHTSSQASHLMTAPEMPRKTSKSTYYLKVKGTLRYSVASFIFQSAATQVPQRRLARPLWPLSRSQIHSDETPLVVEGQYHIRPSSRH